jgi:MFS transporter, ceroid-lipofuscinosis neuronal protein 7
MAAIAMKEPLFDDTKSMSTQDIHDGSYSIPLQQQQQEQQQELYTSQQYNTENGSTMSMTNTIATTSQQEEADGIYNLRTTDYVAMDISMLERAQNENNNSLKKDRSENHNGNNNNDDDDDDDDVTSVISADGIHDVTGFICVCFVILIGDMSRGIFFPSMWPLVESLGGTKVVLGYAVAAFSFGRILVNPIFGSWSHTYGYTKTLLLSCTILLIGTLLYAQVENVGHVQFLIVAQTILGIGSGTLGVTRAFVADVTARRNRTRYMGLITAVQYGGFTVTPALGSLFNKMFYNDDHRFGLFRLNMFTAPAYCMATIVLLVIVVLLVFFRERERIDTIKSSKSQKKNTKRQIIEDYASEKVSLFGGRFNYFTIYDLCIIGCMLLNVATKGSIASFETLGIAIAEEYFDMSSSMAGLIIAGCGLCGVIALLNLGILERNFPDVYIIAGGMIVMLSGIFGLLILDEVNSNGNGGYHRNDNSDWGFVTSMFLIYGIGYPVGHTAVIGLFSKSTSLFEQFINTSPTDFQSTYITNVCHSI